jgi:hypothetical protein
VKSQDTSLRAARDGCVEYESLSPSEGTVIPARGQTAVQIPILRSQTPLNASLTVRVSITCALFLDGSWFGDSRTRERFAARRETARREWAAVVRALEKANSGAASGPRRLDDASRALDAERAEVAGGASTPFELVKRALQYASALRRSGTLMWPSLNCSPAPAASLRRWSAIVVRASDVHPQEED